MNDTPRTDIEADDARNFALYYDCQGKHDNIPVPIVVPADFARTLERELTAAIRERDSLANRFTKLDKPKYSGAPMMDSVLGTPNADFRAWVDSLPPTYWTRYDLSAARIGWEAAKKCNPDFEKCNRIVLQGCNRMV
jgi:hypothetical protein